MLVFYSREEVNNIMCGIAGLIHKEKNRMLGAR